jgi:hypothetical protein
MEAEHDMNGHYLCENFIPTRQTSTCIAYGPYISGSTILLLFSSTQIYERKLGYLDTTTCLLLLLEEFLRDLRYLIVTTSHRGLSLLVVFVGARSL